MSPQPVIYVTGPNGKQEPVCLIPIPAADHELMSLEEWLGHERACAQRDPLSAPKLTKADDDFDVDNATPDKLWAYVVEKSSKAHLEDVDADTEALKAKL